jgi:hypothetical protein
MRGEGSVGFLLELTRTDENDDDDNIKKEPRPKGENAASIRASVADNSARQADEWLSAATKFQPQTSVREVIATDEGDTGFR